jgi:hypothetical protein
MRYNEGREAMEKGMMIDDVQCTGVDRGRRIVVERVDPNLISIPTTVRNRHIFSIIRLTRTLRSTISFIQYRTRTWVRNHHQNHSYVL